jgi:hypothetical protein
MAEQIRTPNPISNKKICDMAKVIVDRQKVAKDIDFKKVDLNSLEEDWFDWIEEILFENGAVIQKPLQTKINLEHIMKEVKCEGCGNFNIQCTCYESSKNDFLNTVK